MDLKERLISELRNQKAVYEKELESYVSDGKRTEIQKKIKWINEMLSNYR